MEIIAVNQNRLLLYFLQCELLELTLYFFPNISKSEYLVAFFQLRNEEESV